MSTKQVSHEKQFSVRTYENDKLIREQIVDDPFIRTTITVRGGLRAAWDALRGKMKFAVWVDGSRESHRVIFQGDYTPDPVGPSQSHSMEGAYVNQAATR